MERTPKTIADLLEERPLAETPKLAFACESREEALALAVELQSRGWRASACRALTFKGETNEMTLVDVVDIDRRLTDEPDEEDD